MRTILVVAILLMVASQSFALNDAPSTDQWNVDIAGKVVAPDHPITAGLHDFVLRDEMYRGVRMRPDITPLLMAEDHPLAWTRTESKSRIVGIIVGHGPAYKDDNFRTLLRQSIRWAAKRTN
jgi:type 1 glutamine amidotransferase